MNFRLCIFVVAIVLDRRSTGSFADNVCHPTDLVPNPVMGFEFDYFNPLFEIRDHAVRTENPLPIVSRKTDVFRTPEEDLDLSERQSCTSSTSKHSTCFSSLGFASSSSSTRSASAFRLSWRSSSGRSSNGTSCSRSKTISQDSIFRIFAEGYIIVDATSHNKIVEGIIKHQDKEVRSASSNEVFGAVLADDSFCRSREDRG